MEQQQQQQMQQPQQPAHPARPPFGFYLFMGIVVAVSIGVVVVLVASYFS